VAARRSTRSRCRRAPGRARASSEAAGSQAHLFQAGTLGKPHIYSLRLRQPVRRAGLRGRARPRLLPPLIRRCGLGGLSFSCGCRIFGFAWKADHSGGAQELAASPPSASPSLPRRRFRGWSMVRTGCFSPAFPQGLRHERWQGSARARPPGRGSAQRASSSTSSAR
jgi:hypothetical protein